MEVPVSGAACIGLGLSGDKHALPNTASASAVEATGDGLPGTIAFGQIAPSWARARDPQHSIRDAVVLGRRTTDLWSLRPVRRSASPTPVGGARLPTTDDCCRAIAARSRHPGELVAPPSAPIVAATHGRARPGATHRSRPPSPAPFVPRPGWSPRQSQSIRRSPQARAAARGRRACH